MQKFIFSCCLLFAFLLYAEEEQQKPLNIEEGVSAIINGCVNAISGDYMQSSNDLVVVGPEPLVFERFYTSSDYQTRSLYSGWRHNHDSFIIARGIPGIDNVQNFTADYIETSGRCATYHGKKEHHLKAIMCSACNKSLTNCGLGLISGRTNPKNTVLSYNTKEQRISVTNGSGSKVKFKRGKDAGRVYALQQERKPNSHLLKYEYCDKRYDIFSQVTATDSNDKLTYGWIKIVDKDSKDFKKNPGFEVHASDGRKVVYRLKKFSCAQREKEKGLKGHFYISDVERTDAPKVHYDYARKPGSHKARIIAKVLPEGRFQNIVYHEDEDDLFLIDRVRELQAPVGTDSTPHTTHRFKYSAKITKKDPLQYEEGTTEVYDALGHKTVYSYNAEHKLSEIKRFKGTKAHQLYSIEKYMWGDPKSANATNLLSRCLLNSDGNPISARVFKYDERGNIIKESCYGNLTGSSKPLICSGGLPEENGVDCYSTQYSYSDDGMNLMLKQTHDNGKVELYSYFPGTDLLASKLLGTAKGKKTRICQRQFFQYDKNGVTIKQIIDDGNTAEESNLTGVTERLITYTTPKKSAPIGVPEQIDEMYLDIPTGKELLLKRTRNTYSIEGRLLKQELYDSDGVFLYSLNWEYDPHGNIISEQDALGQCTNRQYDANNNLIFEQKPSGLQTHLTYDFSNRLISTEEVDASGSKRSSANSYDLLSNRISSCDVCGNETKYTYDPFGRATKITYSPTPNEVGELKGTHIQKKYDVLGNVTTLIDQCGHTTSTHYNILNKPTEIHYPDGTCETFLYNTDGTLRQSVAKNGMVSLYEYDCFGRQLKKECFGADGQLLDSVTSVYNAFHLITTIDAEGISTHFHYDGAGRLVSTTKGDRKTAYEYDSCGRVHKLKEWYGDGPNAFRLSIKLYDLLNRIIEEVVKDGSSNETLRYSSFSYDADNNIISETRGDSTTIREFNGWKQPTKIIDPEGNVSKTIYAFNYRNAFKQTVPQITSIDPLGVQTIKTMNALNQVGNITKKNAMGKVISQQRLFYSGVGDLQQTIDTVFTENGSERIVKTRWNHNAMHQLQDLIEAEGTPEQKHTAMTYNNFGQKDSIVKPDGSIILHRYDAKGRLKTFQGNGFSYTYEYDRNDNILSVADSNNSKVTHRKYDATGNMIFEQLGSGLDVQYAYDKLGRPTMVTFPDDSAATYRYNASNLQQVSRIDSSGKELYQHHYTGYNQQGLVTDMQLIGNAGECTCKYDSMGRIAYFEAPDWSETLHYDSVGNLLTLEENQKKTSTFTYNDLYQLKSETGSSPHTYEWDSLYNCVKKDDTENKINSLNQLLQQGKTSFTYDGNGNRITQTIQGQVIKYAYDGLDRLISVTQGSSQTKYTYDAFNRRLSKCNLERIDDTWELTSETTYLYHGQNEVGACDTTGKIVELRILGVGKGAEIGATIAIEIGTTTSVPLHDCRGNIVRLLDPRSGKCLESYQYSAFGEEQIFDASGDTLSESSLGNPWRFSSKRHDPETDLIYFGRRYYDPKTFSWTSPDPIGFEGGPNLYAYVMNNPLTHIDLYGLEMVQQGSKWVYQTTWKTQWRYHASGWNSDRRREPWRIPGRLIAAIGKHFMPIPIVRNVIIACGHFLEGHGLNVAYREQLSYNKTIGSHESSTLERHIAVNGVLTESYEFEESVKDMSVAYGGNNIHATHNSTGGLITDGIECIAQHLGIKTDPVSRLVQNLRACINDVGPDGRVYLHAHSQGGLISYRAIKELEYSERELLHVYTYGSAKIIDADTLGIAKATNYVSLCDPIPFISDPIGIARSIFTNYGNVKFLKPHNLPLIDHFFNGKSYQQAFKRIADSFRNRYAEAM